MLSNSLADIVQYVSQVLEIARSVTNQTSNDTAKELFIKRLNESDMYFVDKPIPANESDENAHVLCSSVDGAKKYCPNRWKAMQNWFAEARKVKKNEILKYISYKQQQLCSPSSPFSSSFACITSILYRFSSPYHLFPLLSAPSYSLPTIPLLCFNSSFTVLRALFHLDCLDYVCDVFVFNLDHFLD